MGNYSIDFETTTVKEDCRVWGYGIQSIDDLDEPPIIGNNIDDFMRFCSAKQNHTLYVHNLKFDGEFIFYWLFKNGFQFVTSRKKMPNKSFTALISVDRRFYSMEIVFWRGNKHVNRVSIYDSLKILPFSVEEIADAFGLGYSKGDIDYKLTRPVGYKMTAEEKDYIARDVKIVAEALSVLFGQGLKAMTQASNAMSDYKDKVGPRNFRKWFPPPKEYDYFIRQAYRGGFTYVNPIYRNREILERGIVLDVNSLYPFVMRTKLLPYDEGIFFEGEYKPDEVYNLYVQLLRCDFKIKEGRIPTIQIKNSNVGYFVETEYLTDSHNETPALCLTSIDLKLFKEQYDIYNLEYISGWKFKSTYGLFDTYIDEWTKVKIESSKNGNKGMRTLAKLMMNALYGRFALNPKVQSKYPYLGEDDIVRYQNGPEEMREPIYIPMGVFITAYARDITIRAAQSVYERFLYADTDSLHLLGEELPEELEIDPEALGAWKHEGTFARAKYIRSKCYIEEMIVTEQAVDKYLKKHWKLGLDHLVTRNGDQSRILMITCAGMPTRCYPGVTWENFVMGSEFDGRLQMEHVPGGIILNDIKYTIKMSA